MCFSKVFFIISLFLYQNSNAQDGSNIRYFNVSDIDTAFIGKEVHLDFYNLSFGGIKRDSVVITIKGKPTLFLENRKDDHFNNWFSQQYLEEIKNTGNEKLRIIKSVIKEITLDSILVTSYFDLFDGKTKIPGKSFTQNIWFEKKIITQVLVHSEPCCK